MPSCWLFLNLDKVLILLPLLETRISQLLIVISSATRMFSNDWMKKRNKTNYLNTLILNVMYSIYKKMYRKTVHRQWIKKQQISFFFLSSGKAITPTSKHPFTVQGDTWKWNSIQRNAEIWIKNTTLEMWC